MFLVKMLQIDLDHLDLGKQRKSSENVRNYDSGFLDRVIGELDNGSSVQGAEVLPVLEDFADIHSRVMIYFKNMYKDWMVGVYAYENVRFLPLNGILRGRVYHVTGFDGTRRDGDFGDIFSSKPEFGVFAMPKFIHRKMKAVVVAQEYEFNRGKYHIELLVGDNFSESVGVEMPVFRGKGY